MHVCLSSTEACSKMLQEMNPLVKVSCLKTASLNASTLSQFDAVCFTGGSLGEQASLNAQCRNAGVKFCSARCHGPFGWIFLDLLHHTYTTDVNLPSFSFVCSLSFSPKKIQKRVKWISSPWMSPCPRRMNSSRQKFMVCIGF